MILFRAKKIIFMICFAFLFFSSLVTAEQIEQDIDKQYEHIVKSIKDKPFDKLLKTPEIDKWCAILCNYRTNEYDDFKDLGRKIDMFSESLLDVVNG